MSVVNASPVSACQLGAAIHSAAQIGASSRLLRASAITLAVRPNPTPVQALAARVHALYRGAQLDGPSLL